MAFFPSDHVHHTESSHSIIPACTKFDHCSTEPSRSSSRSTTSSVSASGPSPSPRSMVQTRPMPLGSSGVFFEREPVEPTEDDILLVTVKLSFKPRSSSLDGSDELPTRPPRRSFLKRMSTRLLGESIDFKQYKTLRMPRSEYRRYFAKDKEMRYIGTEPEREWDEEELRERFGAYQHLPLHAGSCWL